jgi:hypothetical protein
LRYPLRRCAGGVTQLGHGTYPSATNLRPTVDHPQRAIIGVDHDRLAAVLERIAADVDELARARRVADLAEATRFPGGQRRAIGPARSTTMLDPRRSTLPRLRGTTLVKAMNIAPRPGTLAKMPCGPRIIRPVRTSYLDWCQGQTRQPSASMLP